MTMNVIGIGLVTILLSIFLLLKIPKMETKLIPKDELSQNGFSIIIPARNEEATIGKLLSSIMSEAVQPLEVIVVNDHSTDRTKQIAHEYGAKVVDNPPLPLGWLGKSWACWNGVKHAKGNILLFMDADTWFTEAGFLRAVHFFQEQKKSILSIHPYHQMKQGYEKLSAIFHLVVFIASGVTTPFGKKRGGFGQCLICEKEAYFAIGGHESIKGEIVENLALIQHASSKGISAHSYSGKAVISMRMYQDGIGSVWKGWGKSFASGSTRTSFPGLMMIILWISSLFSFLTNRSSLEQPYVFAIIYLILVLLFYRSLKDIGNFTLLDASFFPVHLLFFFLVFVYSFIRTFVLRNTSWKGRSITISKQKDG